MHATPTDTSCGCPDYTLGRRRFLGAAAATAGILAGAQLFGDSFRQVAYGAETGNNVVVVLSLRGGADGLSMVVPRGADHDTLAAQRPGIVLPEASLIGGDARFGLHPAFAPLLPMWQAGSFGAVHGVGLPAPNRSHFDAMVEIEDAEIGSSLRTGWLNRAVGLTSSALPESAMSIGSVVLPTSLTGPSSVLGVNQLADIAIANVGSSDAARRTSITTLWADDDRLAGDAAREAVATTERLAPLVTSTASKDTSPVRTAAYPAGPLNSVLANTSALIRADVGARFVTVDYGNWDMHTNLGGTDSGWMHDQVTHLASSLAAFFKDLEGSASRVTVVTMSEFGRRVTQNGGSGLDHGYGNVMMMLGAGVNGGAVHGTWPGLSTKPDTDLGIGQWFQEVLWEVLVSRFSDISGSRTTVFPGLNAPRPIGAMT